MESIYLFYLLLFIVAFLYSSVGHGGASGYLALMAIFAVSPELMKPSALLLNLFVSLTAFSQFYRAKQFKWHIFIPLALASIPMAFLGGMINLDANIYRKTLGFLLLIPVLRFLLYKNSKVQTLQENSLYISIFIGSAIGFLSGLIGIGGGIILSPVLLLLRWTDQKETAAISALFIFVNSFSGLAGHVYKGVAFSPDLISFVGIAFVGGLLGSYLGSMKFNQTVLKNTLAIVLLVAGLKLIFTS